MRKLVWLALILLPILTYSITAKAETNFISQYIDSKGGCTPNYYVEFFQGSAYWGKNGVYGGSPFGKPLEDWTEADLALLKDEIEKCRARANPVYVGKSRAGDVSDFGFFRQLANKVELAKNAKNARERQEAAKSRLADQERLASKQAAEQEALAKQQAAEQRIKQSRQDSATTEVNSFYGHVMSDPELDRAQQLKKDFPMFAARIDGLLDAQQALKQQEAAERKQAEDRAAAEQKIEAARKKQALEAQLAAEEAEVEAEKKKQAFTASLPETCKSATALDQTMRAEDARNKMITAASLAQAGDIENACKTFIEFASNIETLRSKLVQCTKELGRNNDPLSDEAAATYLNRAIEVHGKQKDFQKQLDALKCK